MYYLAGISLSTGYKGGTLSMWRKVATRICAISGQQEQDLIRHHLPIAKSTYVCRKLEKENGGTERKLLKIQS